VSVLVLIELVLLAALVAWVWDLHRRISATRDVITRMYVDQKEMRMALENIRNDSDDNELVVPAPQIRGNDLRDWLQHYTQRSWPDAVREFYTRAAADPQIAPYFHAVDLPDLQRHFTTAVILLTSKGLTRGTLRRLADRHASVRTPDGTPITAEIYDKTVGVLIDILVEWGVPKYALADLGRLVEPLREVIVAKETVSKEPA